MADVLDELFVAEKIAKGYLKSDIVRMKEVYFLTFGTYFDTTCMRCVANAWDELKIYYLSKKNPTMKKSTQQFQMNRDALLDIAGTFYNHNTITDDVVLKFISRHSKPAMEKWLKATFDHYPENWDEMVSSFAKTGSVPEKNAPIDLNISQEIINKETRTRIQKNSNKNLEKLCKLYPESEWKTLNREERIDFLVSKAE